MGFLSRVLGVEKEYKPVTQVTMTVSSNTSYEPIYVITFEEPKSNYDVISVSIGNLSYNGIYRNLEDWCDYWGVVFNKRTV